MKHQSRVFVVDGICKSFLSFGNNFLDHVQVMSLAALDRPCIELKWV